MSLKTQWKAKGSLKKNETTPTSHGGPILVVSFFSLNKVKRKTRNITINKNIGEKQSLVLKVKSLQA